MGVMLIQEFLIQLGDIAYKNCPSTGSWLTKNICNAQNSLCLTINSDRGTVYKANANVCTGSGGATNPVLTLTFNVSGLGNQIVYLRQSYFDSPCLVHVVDFSGITEPGVYSLTFWNDVQSIRASGWRTSG